MDYASGELGFRFFCQSFDVELVRSAAAAQNR